MTDFLWHKVSEKEKKQIQEQAKKIMDDFSKKLDKVKGKIDDSYSEREDFGRKEGKEENNEINREIVFKNAPDKNKDFLVAEKGEW